jgi:glutathione peroxidase-family protein
MKILIKLSFIIIAFLLLSNINPPKYIYGIKFKDIDGNQTDLLRYRGEKMMVIIISGQEKDSVWLNPLMPFYQRYKDSIGIVAIPSIEDGYTESNKTIVKRLFSERGIKALITEGFYTRKAAGANQAELMQWFTNKEHNMRFERDIMGPGHRFFLDEMGGLQYSVFPGIPYSVPFIQKYMSWPVRPYPVIPRQQQEKKQN